MKRSDVKEAVSANAFTFHKDGTVTAKWGYFYRFEKTPEKYAEYVKAKVPGAKIIEVGDHYHDFVGGAKTGSAKSSYMWVKFMVGD
jgi:hypothetical protein